MDYKNVLLVTIGLELGSDYSATVKVSRSILGVSEVQNGYWRQSDMMLLAS